MKKHDLLALFMLFLISTGLSAQEQYGKTFHLKNVSSASLQQEYVSALENADFSCYRLLNSERTLIFNDGTEVILCSAISYRMQSNTTHKDCYLSEEDYQRVADRKFTLQNGYVVEVAENKPGKFKGH